MSKPRDNYKTSNNFRILLSPKVIKHLQAHPQITHELLEKVCSRVDVSGGKMESQIVEVDLGEVVGASGRVPTPQVSPTDPCWFAKRTGRPNYSRVVLEWTELPTSFVTLVLTSTKKANTYNLITCWIGTCSIREPTDMSVHKGSKDFDESLLFWSQHALTYDKATMGTPIESCWANILGLGT